MNLTWPMRFVVLALAALPPTAPAQSPLGTAFTYQGRLEQSGVPANGSFPMEFKLFDDAAAGNQVGPTLTFDGLGGHPAPVNAANGLFTASLDFDTGAFGADARWLEITVSGTTLSPRTKVVPTPAALFSAAPWATVGSTISYTGGKVGIGTSSPAALLHLSDTGWPTARLDSTSAVGTWLRLNNTSLGGRLWSMVSTGSSNGEGPGKLIFHDQSAGTRMAITEAGNVGIGTSSPTARLTVQRANATPEVARFVDGGSLSQLRFSAVSFRAELQAWNGDTDAAAPLALNPAGGNVGIGTASPQDALHLGSGALRFPDNSRQTTAFSPARAAASIDFGSFGTGTAVGTIGVPGAEVGGSVSISPDIDLPNGLVIAWARVSSAGTVRFAIRNTTASAIDPPPITFFTTVINP